MTKMIYKIKGMDCPSCATLLECELEDVGIKAKINFAKETLETESDKEKEMLATVTKSGYKISK